MPESQTTERDADVQDMKQEGGPKKRVRHRKKQLYENLLKQMEFYFSDANLIKDRFLGELVKNDPYVPLETFLKFNRIRNVTQEVSDIAKAMKHSTFLELSEDKTKVSISSIKAFLMYNIIVGLMEITFTFNPKVTAQNQIRYLVQ